MNDFARLGIVAGLSTLTCSFCLADIIPSWRVNPIPHPPPGGNTALIDAFSVSLMVELTEGSLFSVAGLDLAALFPSPVTFFNTTFQGPVSPALLAAFPDLGFNSYVTTTIDQTPAIPGRLNGSGSAQVGTGGQFNVAWGAIPNTGGTGPREIARITILNHVPLAPSMHIPVANGLVRDNLNPSVDVTLPPMPLIVPEPSVATFASMILLRRRR